MSAFVPSRVRVQQGVNNGGFVYNNPNGSRFVQNADGSKFYDPGPNGVGEKWFESADGVRTYISDAQSRTSPAKNVKMEEQEVRMTWGNREGLPVSVSPKPSLSKPRNKVKKDYNSDDTMPLHPKAGMLTPLYSLTVHRCLEDGDNKGNSKEMQYHNKTPCTSEIKGQCIQPKRTSQAPCDEGKACRNTGEVAKDPK